MERIDIAVVGLGPAGAILTSLLPKRFSVAAFDRKGSGWRKPCGGLLAPDAQKALASLGLTLPRELLVDPQIFSVRTVDLQSGLQRHYQRFYLNLDRARFDSWLRSLVPAHVEVHDDCHVTAVVPEDGGWRIEYREANELYSLHSKYVIGADGANSAVRRAICPDAHIRNYVAIQQWFEDRHPRPFYSCIFDPEATDCYSWSISKDGSFIFGGAYPAEHCRDRFEMQKRRLSELGFLFGAPLKTEACLVLRPAHASQLCPGKNGAFLIGEAAGLISPSSLEGVSWALRSAMLLRDALESDDPRRIYDHAFQSLRLKITVKLLKCPFMYQPILRKWVMKSGLQSINVAD
ncbi:MAG: FAD-binding protein [Clostridiaceae bacterium]|nr:FAD-binding protein [Clostridiaceae bacterium]